MSAADDYEYEIIPAAGTMAWEMPHVLAHARAYERAVADSDSGRQLAAKVALAIHGVRVVSRAPEAR